MNQIKKPIITLSIGAVLLALIPYMALWLDKYFTHIGIGIIALLWIIVCPIYFLIVGITLGKHYKTKLVWVLPIAFMGVIYVINSLTTSFSIWEYFIIYFLVSYIAMGITALMQKSKEYSPETYKKMIKVAIIALIGVIIAVVLFIVSMIVTNTIYSSSITTGITVVTNEDEATDIPTLLENRTEYIGDNSAVGNLINELSFPGTVKYDKFELQTEEEPYALTVYFTTDSGPLKFYKDDIAWDGFYENQIILFSLIGNVEEIKFNLSDGNEYIEMTYPRTTAEDEYGDLFERTETLEGFYELQDELFLERNAE